jgi:deoxyribodipyrimidine photo-lyase
VAGGERAGREALQRFLSGPVDGYDDGRDQLTGERVSHLSPYLHFGCLTPREIEHRLATEAGATAYRRQLCWRDFYAHVLGHFPANAHREYQERYRATIRWSRAEKRFAAWCDGQTGYPAVGAGMRQLKAEGWMHNRVRLLVGAVLIKDLGIDRRWGERHFMRLLLDGDEPPTTATGSGSPRSASTRSPPFGRIFNPARQQGALRSRRRLRAPLCARAGARPGPPPR